MDFAARRLKVEHWNVRESSLLFLAERVRPANLSREEPESEERERKVSREKSVREASNATRIIQY